MDPDLRSRLGRIRATLDRGDPYAASEPAEMRAVLDGCAAALDELARLRALEAKARALVALLPVATTVSPHRAVEILALCADIAGPPPD